MNIKRIYYKKILTHQKNRLLQAQLTGDLTVIPCFPLLPSLALFSF